MQNKTKLKFDQDFKACAMARKTLHFLICKGTKGEFVYYRITFKEKNCWIAMKMRVSSCIPLLQIDQRYVAEAGGGRPGHLRSVSNVIWILSSDTICQLNQLFLNSEAAMLSRRGIIIAKGSRTQLLQHSGRGSGLDFQTESNRVGAVTPSALCRA